MVPEAAVRIRLGSRDVLEPATRDARRPLVLAPAIQGLRPWDTLCFASDYPHWDSRRARADVAHAPAEWRENVAWRNAASFYRLPVPAVV